MTDTALILYIGSIMLARTFCLLCLEIFCLTPWAKDRIIYPRNQKYVVDRKKELVLYIFGLLFEALLTMLLIKFSILNFNESTFSGVLMLILSFAFVIEPLYYFYHRLLHTPVLYNNHHIFHHRNLQTKPMSAFYFTLLERISYTILFAIPIFITSIFGLLSPALLFIYIVLFDIANAVGHTNVRIFPKGYSNSFWHLFFYPPEFHADHHKYFRTNYSLFMPIWDKIFGTYRKKQP